MMEIRTDRVKNEVLHKDKKKKGEDGAYNKTKKD